MTRKTGLGRGLDALIVSGDSSSEVRPGVKDVAVGMIIPNPHQPLFRNIYGNIRSRGVENPAE